MLEETSGAVYVNMDITFILIEQKDESAMVKSKLHPEQKQLKAANTTLALCEHLHRQHANTKTAKAVMLKLSLCTPGPAASISTRPCF